MGKFLTNEQIQKQLDERKWLDSQEYGKDMCGEYDYCLACDKSKKYPCASAQNKYKRKIKKILNA